MKWNNFKERPPTDSVDALIYVKWNGDPDFSIEIDRWQIDSNDERRGYWMGIEDHCEFVETVADGPGFCTRPLISHWMMLPEKPETN